jgi:hypothetical protein
VTWILVEGRAVPTLAIVSAAYLGACALVALWLRPPEGAPTLFAPYERAPLRGLYLAWLPLCFLIALVRAQPAYGWLVAIELWWKRYQMAADVRLVCRAAGLSTPWRR